MTDELRTLLRQKIVDSLAMPAPALTRRDVWLPSVPAKKATAVIGMRRAGKTSLLWQLLAQRLAAGAAREDLLYFSFEDERLAGMGVADLDLMVQEYFKLHPQARQRRRVTFFLDEIQLVPGWELFARRLLDTENVEVFLSGSSARLLSREVATSMRGRAMEAVVQPFSFRECLRHAGAEPAQPVERLTNAQRSTLEQRLRHYLRAGGFPEAQGQDDRSREILLGGYVDVLLLRDVIERHAVSHPLALRWMVRQLLGNAAGAFSVNKFHADLKSQNIAVGKETLYAYLTHLEDAFLLRSVGIATDSEQRRRVNPRKAYPVDMGLVALFDRSGKANTGHALETAVALELGRRGAEIAYVRTADDFEVDFLARFPGGRSQLIQVCAQLDDPLTLARELRALAQARAEHPQAELLLIVLDAPIAPQLPEGVTLMAALDWLLMQ